MGQKQLNDYLREVRDKPFRWGEHDCLIFSNAALKAYHGLGYAEDWFGRYCKDGKPKKTDEMRQEFGVDCFDEMINAKLTQISQIPPKGAIVATYNTAERHCAVRFIPYALGISLGTKAAFISPSGVLCLPLDDVAKAWVHR